MPKTHRGRKAQTKQAPPIKRACPVDDQGEDMCSFHYSAVTAKDTDSDWLAQHCNNCRHLMFIDKRKLTHGASS